MNYAILTSSKFIRLGSAPVIYHYQQAFVNQLQDLIPMYGGSMQHPTSSQWQLDALSTTNSSAHQCFMQQKITKYSSVISWAVILICCFVFLLG